MRVITLNQRIGTVIGEPMNNGGIVDLKLDRPYENGWGRMVREERAFTNQLRFVDEDGHPVGECGDVRKALEAASPEQKDHLRALIGQHAGHPVAEAVRNRMNELRGRGSIRTHDVVTAVQELEALAA